MRANEIDEITTQRELIGSINSSSLKKLAGQLDVPGNPARKDELTEAFDVYLENNLLELLDQLGSLERKLLAETVYNGPVEPGRFEARHGDICSLPSRTARKRDVTPLRLLCCFEDGNVIVPEDLKERLSSYLKQPEPASIDLLDKRPEEITGENLYGNDDGHTREVRTFCGERVVFPELQEVLRLVKTDTVRVKKNGWPRKPSARDISDVLVVPDYDFEPPEGETLPDAEDPGFGRASAWGALLQLCGWAHNRNGTLELSDQGKSMLTSPEPIKMENALGDLFLNENLDELSRVSNLRGQTGKASRYMTNPSQRRLAIVDAMSDWPAGRWFRFEEAYRYLEATGNSFTVCEEPVYLYFQERRYGHLSGHRDLNRHYMRVLLFEVFATLGLIDVGYVYPHGLWPEFGDRWGTDRMWFCSRYDGLLYLRLNPLGAFCLGQTDEYEAPAGQEVHFDIASNREIRTRDGQSLPAPVRHQLEKFSVSTEDGHHELNARSILDFVQKGGRIEEVRNFLRDHSGGTLPGEVREFLDDLRDRKEVVQEKCSATLVEVRDEKTARFIAEESEAGTFCKQTADGNLVVPDRNMSRFRTAIKKIGFVLPE